MLNEDVLTNFPVVSAVGKLEPGIYVITARPWKSAANPPTPAPMRACSSRRNEWSFLISP
jgi:hypothetical protein